MAVKTAAPVKIEETEYTYTQEDVTRIPLKYVHLHAPLFFGRINFGEKIEAGKKGNLAIVHYIDKGTGRNELHFTDPKGQAAYLPFVGNVACAIPVSAGEADVQLLVHVAAKPVNPTPKGKVQAQASAPAGIIIGR